MVIWLDNQNHQWKKYRQQHIQMYQGLMGQCNLMNWDDTQLHSNKTKNIIKTRQHMKKTAEIMLSRGRNTKCARYIVKCEWVTTKENSEKKKNCRSRQRVTDEMLTPSKDKFEFDKSDNSNWGGKKKTKAKYNVQSEVDFHEHTTTMTSRTRYMN